MSLYLRLLIILLFLLSLFGLVSLVHKWLRYRIRRAEAYQPRPGDIFIVTFQGSGTTLMQMMLHQLTSDGSMNITHILSVSPWFEYELIVNSRSRELFESLPSPRFFKSHCRYGRLPKSGKFVYIARNLRDVAISNYYKSNVTSGREVSRKACVDRTLRERLPWVSWYKHVESGWPHRNDENVLFLTYESIVGDLAGTARKVASFCGIEIDERDLPRIVERCGIGFMKQHWDKFDPRLRRVSRTPAEFIRKGGVGNGRSELTPDQEALASHRLARLAAKLGCISGEPHSELFA